MFALEREVVGAVEAGIVLIRQSSIIIALAHLLLCCQLEHIEGSYHGSFGRARNSVSSLVGEPAARRSSRWVRPQCQRCDQVPCVSNRAGSPRAARCQPDHRVGRVNRDAKRAFTEKYNSREITTSVWLRPCGEKYRTPDTRLPPYLLDATPVARIGWHFDCAVYFDNLE